MPRTVGFRERGYGCRKLTIVSIHHGLPEHGVAVEDRNVVVVVVAAGRNEKASSTIRVALASY
jgi:hypothetical protein